MTCFFRTASLSPNVDRTRDFVGQGQTDEEREEEAKKAKEQEEKEKREKEEMDMPLQLATLPGKQEIVLKFTEMNQVNISHISHSWPIKGWQQILGFPSNLTIFNLHLHL